MTGYHALNVTTRTGFWTLVHDGGKSFTPWERVRWTAEVPERTQLGVWARSAESEEGLEEQEWVWVENDVPLENVGDGRFLQVEAEFWSGKGDASPILYDLTVVPKIDLLRHVYDDRQIKPEEAGVADLHRYGVWLQQWEMSGAAAAGQYVMGRCGWRTSAGMEDEEVGVSVFGDWQPGEALAVLHEGAGGEVETDFSFQAPVEAGTYRVCWVAWKGAVGCENFYGKVSLEDKNPEVMGWYEVFLQVEGSNAAEAGGAVVPVGLDVVTKAGAEWTTDYERALTFAQQQEKPLLLVFMKSGQHACEAFEESLAAAGEMLERFVLVWLEGDGADEAAVTLGVKTYPTVIFLTAEGEMVHRVGYLQPKAFLGRCKVVYQKMCEGGQ